MQVTSIIQKINTITSELQEQAKLLSVGQNPDPLDVEMMRSNVQFLETQVEILLKMLPAKVTEAVIQNEPEQGEKAIVPVREIEKEEEQEQDTLPEEVSHPTAAEAVTATNQSADAIPKQAGATLNEKLKAPKVSLNERLNTGRKESTLAGELNRQNVRDLNEAITLNERFLLTKELFNGNSKQFSLCLDHINKLQSFGHAETYLQEEVAVPYNWNEKKEAVSIFYQVLQRKFNE
jgi:hypothetical protein